MIQYQPVPTTRPKEFDTALKKFDNYSLAGFGIWGVGFLSLGLKHIWDGAMMDMHSNPETTGCWKYRVVEWTWINHKFHDLLNTIQADPTFVNSLPFDSFMSSLTESIKQGILPSFNQYQWNTLDRELASIDSPEKLYRTSAKVQQFEMELASYVKGNITAILEHATQIKLHHITPMMNAANDRLLSLPECQHPHEIISEDLLEKILIVAVLCSFVVIGMSFCQSYSVFSIIKKNSPQPNQPIIPSSQPRRLSHSIQPRQTPHTPASSVTPAKLTHIQRKEIEQAQQRQNTPGINPFLQVNKENEAERTIKLQEDIAKQQQLISEWVAKGLDPDFLKRKNSV